MKAIRSVLLCGIALAASFYFVHAQSDSPTSTSYDDLMVMIQAIEQTTPMPASAATNGCNFYSTQHLPGTENEWPPMPGNIINAPAWYLGDGFYLLADADVDYDALAAAQAASASPMMRMSMMASSLASSFAYGNSVYLSNLTASIAGDGSTTVSFSITGGTNFVAYDIEMTTNLPGSADSWTWLSIGYTANRYSFSGQPADLAFYRLAKPSKTMMVGIGNDVVGQCDVPYGLTNALQIAGGGGQSLALKTDGTAVGWGQNYYGQATLPTNLTGIAMIAAGWYHSVAMLTNGTVVAWGYNAPSLGFTLTNVPADLTNAIVISAQALHTLALRDDGTVVAWGYNDSGETNIPAGLSNVIAIAAGYQFNLAVTTNGGGTVVAWGGNSDGQCDVPAGLSNVVDVAAGTFQSLALLQNGTVVAWGDDYYGEASVPVGLTNVVAIAASGDPGYGAYSMALKSDGAVVTWGDDDATDPVNGLSNVISIAAGADHALAVRTGPPTPVITLAPVDQYKTVGETATFTARGAALYEVTYQWQTNGMDIPGATSNMLTLTNVQLGMEGPYNVLVTDNGGMGSLISSIASLHLITPPVILSQSPMPTNQIAIFQTNLTLSVIASAPGTNNGFPLHYQWQFNGANIGGNSNSDAVFVDTPNLGAYACIVTNAAGSTTSLVWQVSATYVGSYIDVGTLAYHLSTNAVDHASGYSSIYSNMLELANWTSATYSETNLALLTNSVWSTNCWLHGVQGLSASCIGYSNGTAGEFPVTMVSPRHYLNAYHVSLAPGTMLVFLDTNNIVYLRTVLQKVDIGTNSVDIMNHDTSVGILDADLPPSVGYLPVIPTNFSNYLPTNFTSYVQGIGRHQDMSLFSQPMLFGGSLYANWNPDVAPPFGLGMSWNIILYSGDSSNPEMLLLNNQLILVSANFTALSGPNYAFQIDAINQQMHYLSTNNEVGSDYQLTQFSLTNWPNIH